jgi:hypothetical protein
VTRLRRDMEAAARARGLARPEALTDAALSWWLYDHPAARPEETSINLSGLAEAPKKARGR